MLFGGRWNSKGVRMLYTSESLSLAALEVMAHLPGHKLSNLYCVELELPDNLPVTEIDPLPDQWNHYPYSASTVALGDQFIKANGLCLKVPSAMIFTEYNYLLNPAHDDFQRVKLIDSRPLMLDQRLIDKRA